MTNEDMLHVLRRERECVLMYAGKYREHPENADETPIRCTHDCEGCDLPLDDGLVLETYDRLIAMLEGEEKARTLTLEEIQALPDHTVLWEEVKVVWLASMVRKIHGERIGLTPGTVEVEMAPVEKRGAKVVGSGFFVEIAPEMFGGKKGEYVRYWLGRPTDEQREAEPWQK